MGIFDLKVLSNHMGSLMSRTSGRPIIYGTEGHERIDPTTTVPLYLVSVTSFSSIVSGLDHKCYSPLS